MSDLNQTIEGLWHLQELETVLGAVDQGLGKIPMRIAEIERTLGGAEKALADAKARLANTGKDRRGLEQEIESIRVTIARHQDQLMQVKNNEQYRALTREIAFEKNKIEESEEKILIGMERADELNRAIKQREAELALERVRVEGEKAVLGEERRKLEREREGLLEEHAKLAATLPVEALSLFRRVAQTRGSGIARVNGETCGECRVRARPRALQEARSGDRLVQCESCHRILYIAPSPAPGEAPPAEV